VSSGCHFAFRIRVQCAGALRLQRLFFAVAAFPLFFCSLAKSL